MSLPEETRWPHVLSWCTRVCNLACSQNSGRPLPREWPLWTTHLSEACRWTAAGTEVWEAGPSAGLHRLLVSLQESGSINMESHSLTAMCVKRQGVKNCSQIELWAFQTFPWYQSVVFLLRVDPRVPSTDRYFATNGSWKTLRFCLKCQRKVSD